MENQQLYSPSKPIVIKKFNENEVKTEKTFEKHDLLNKVMKAVISVSDSILAIFLVGPLVVGFWRGTWQLLQMYGSKHPNAIPLWESYFFAVCILLFFGMLRDTFLGYFKKKKKEAEKKKLANEYSEKEGWCKFLQSQFLRKFYTYAFSIACIMHWRASWEIHGLYFNDYNDVIVITSLCLLLLIAMRSLRNIMAPPLILVLDNEDVTFVFPTRFRKKVRRFY